MWATAWLVILTISSAASEWRCPSVSARPAAECSCDLPHTMRCAGDHTAFQIIGRQLRDQKSRSKSTSVSLLDLALRGVPAITTVSVTELAGVGLHALVISSGEIRRVQQGAFASLSSTLLALGLPNNQLPMIPTEALAVLPKLDRLDLSNNKIHTLTSNSFKGIQNLTYLDISDNQLTNIALDTFRPLTKLATLRLRGNLLKVPALASLKSAQFLRDLDLSSNALEGPLSSNTVPTLRYLQTLQLSDNTFASIRRGALAGLLNLTTLNLHNNQIDVLEDYAFKHLNNLTHLDLSHNEIVAVSGASLATLTSLTHLDLSHNFLRSLSAEPLKSLDQLTDLLLHDNDISMIDDGALADHKDLRRFTIEDNPLNCDCLMAGFARWLREAKNLSQSDTAVAVCATPPHLEGALLSRLSKNKLCDDNEHIHLDSDTSNEKVNGRTIDAGTIMVVDTSQVDTDLDQDKYVSPEISAMNYDNDDKSDGLNDDLYDEELDIPLEEDLPISTSKVMLQDAWYDNEEVHLSWTIDPTSNHRYRCTGVTITKTGGVTRHVACHRTPPSNVILRGVKIDSNEEYKFCVAFEEMDSQDSPLALVLGCSSSQSVRKRVTYTPPKVVVAVTTPHTVRDINYRVSEVRSNVTNKGLLTVMVSVLDIVQRPLYLPLAQSLTPDARIFNPFHKCYVVLAVMSRGALVAQKDTPCKTNLEITMNGFMRGPYEVCATISKYKIDEMTPICVVPQLIYESDAIEKSEFKPLNTALVGVALGLLVFIMFFAWYIRKLIKKPPEIEPHRCFRPEPVPEEPPRASYIMLTATSKV